MSKLSKLGPDFDEFVRQSSADLLRLAVLLTGDRHQAEDLLQTSLVRTATHWSAALQSPKAYTRRVLVNLAKNRWRDRGRQPDEAQDLVGIDVAQACADDSVVQRDALLQLVRHLPLEQRKVLVLRFFEDLPVSEVAAVLGCSEGTVKSRTHRALSSLREHNAAQAQHFTQEEPHVHR